MNFTKKVDKIACKWLDILLMPSEVYNRRLIKDPNGKKKTYKTQNMSFINDKNDQWFFLFWSTSAGIFGQ